MEQRRKYLWSLLIVTLLAGSQVAGEALRLPDQQQSTQNVQSIFPPQQQQQQQQQPQQQQLLQQQQQPQSPAGFGEEQGRSLLGLFGLGQENDPYIARTSSKCLTGDLSECFKNQAISSFDEIFFRDQYTLTDFASIVRLPENQQRSLAQEPFEYSQEPRGDDTDWDQLVKYGLRRAERFIKSTALQVDIPAEFTEAGRYDARFIGNDIDSELDVIEDKHAPVFTRKKLKRMIIPLLLVLKIFKLKLLLFLPFILGIVGLKKILTLGALILPGVFAYFKLCRPPGSGPGFGGFFRNTFPEYTSQGVGSATYYHNHEHYDTGTGTGSSGTYYRPEPSFSKPYTDYYSKNYQTGTGNAVNFGEHSGHDAAYSAYYGRNNGKDIASTQKS